MPIASDEDDGEEMGFLKKADGGSEGHGGSSSSGSTAVPVETAIMDAKLPLRRMFTSNMLLVLFTTVLYELHLNSVSVAMANLLVDPVSSREDDLYRRLPFRFGGGAGFRPKSLAWYSTIFGRNPLSRLKVLHDSLSMNNVPQLT